MGRIGRAVALCAGLAVVVAAGTAAVAHFRRGGQRPDAVVTTSTTARAGSTTSVPTTTVPLGDPALAAVRGHLIVVDAGHAGGNSSHATEINRPVFIGTQSRACDATGTQTNDGYPEHAFNLDVALRLQRLLEENGAHVTMVRTEDSSWGPCIDERARIGNRAGAEAGISIHADGGPASGSGFHVNVPANIPGYTDDIYIASRSLGVSLRDAYRTATGMQYANYFARDGLIERRDFGGLNFSDVPKVLFETGNMRNASDAALLENPEFRQKIAYGMALGFAQYFGTSG